MLGHSYIRFKLKTNTFTVAYMDLLEKSIEIS